MAKTKSVLEERRPVGERALLPPPEAARSADVADWPLLQGRDGGPEPSRQPSRKSPLLGVAIQMVIDAVAIAAAFVLAYWLRFESDIAPISAAKSVSTYLFMLLTTVLTILVVFNVSGLYRLRRGTSRIDEFYKIAESVSMGTVCSIAVNSIVLGSELAIYSRLILVVGWVLCILLVTTGRLIFSYVLGVMRKRGISQQRVLLIGTGEPAYNIIERVLAHPEFGYTVAGVLRWDTMNKVPSILGVPVLGTVEQVAEISRAQQIDEVIVAISGASHGDLLDIIASCEGANVSIRIYPDAFLLMTEKEVNVNDLGGLPLLSVKDVALRGWNRTLKRGFDVLFSSAVLILLSPLMLFIAMLIKLDSPGPVFFVQPRVGLDGHTISVIKFRSMRADAGKQPGWTVANDPRRTRLGAWLRRFSIDELPQFVNVLLGEMSVVGPRPEQHAYVRQFSETIPQYMRRHSEKAGITGWAQVNGMRGDTSIEERTRYDIYYVENWSLLLDVKIIFRTVVQIFRGSAY